MAPEMCDCDVKVYNAKKVDVWALGVTLYCMVFNTVPFSRDTGNPYHVMENIKNQKLEMPKQVSPALESLIRYVLVKDPSQRPTV